MQIVNPLKNRINIYLAIYLVMFIHCYRAKTDKMVQK